MTTSIDRLSTDSSVFPSFLLILKAKIDEPQVTQHNWTLLFLSSLDSRLLVSPDRLSLILQHPFSKFISDKDTFLEHLYSGSFPGPDHTEYMLKLMARSIEALLVQFKPQFGNSSSVSRPTRFSPVAVKTLQLKTLHLNSGSTSEMTKIIRTVADELGANSLILQGDLGFLLTALSASDALSEDTHRGAIHITPGFVSLLFEYRL